MSIKKIKNSFTYGLEVEGYFTRGLVAKIRKTGIDCNPKSDCSVYVDKPYNKDLVYGRELAIGVFKKYDDLIKVLSMFKSSGKNQNHWQDGTCGIHIHIKEKRRKGLQNKIADIDFIKDLQEFAEKKLCNQIEKRLTGKTCSDINYTQKYSSLIKTIDDWKYFEKYRFVRNHPSGTLEFRFFSTCKHKVENVKKFFNYMFKGLIKVKNYKERLIKLDNQSTETELKDIIDLRSKETVVDINFKIDKGKTFEMV